LNGEKIEDTGDFIRALNRKDEGDVTLTIIRDKSNRTIKVTPERRPAPTFNLSELQPSGMMSRLEFPAFQMNLPDMHILQSMPKIESFMMPNFLLPKMDNLVLPRVMTVPLIKSLPTVPCVPF
jgi:hypothetical protein